MKRPIGAVAVLLGLSLLALTADQALLTIPTDHVAEGNVRFKVTCNFDHSAPDDPIVYPNQPGASHLHDFTGRIGITASVDTYAELLAGPTTCNDPADHAGYWNPAVDVNGAKRDPSGMTAYYRRGNKHGVIVPYPDGLKVVAGRSLAVPSAPAGVTGWQCNGSALPKATPAGCRTDLTMRVNFPDCWDGVNVDSADHRSHMAYSTYAGDANVCPLSHPVQVPALTTYTHYGNIPRGAVVTLSSGPVDTGVHADFFNGWERARLIERVDTCLNGLLRCDSGA